MSRQTVAFLGVGLMGEPMVRHLLAQGASLRVWNRSAHKLAGVVEAGARPFATPAEAVRGADVVMLCLMDPAAVETVLFGPDGAAEGMGRDSLLVDTSTLGPGPTRTLAARLRAQSGAGWVDAPVTGGVAGAEAGTLIVLAGGAEADLDRVEPLLRAFAREVRRLGPLGCGQAAKLCNQLIVAVNVMAVAEALTVAERNGLDPRLLPRALEGGWADSGPLRIIGQRMADGVSEPPVAAVATLLKDIAAVVASVAEQPPALPLTRAAEQIYRQAAANGLASRDIGAIKAVAEVGAAGPFE